MVETGTTGRGPVPGEAEGRVPLENTAPTILAVMDDPALFGRWFRGPSWDAWRAFLAALFGLPLDEGMRARFERFTGRTAPPTEAAREAWAIVGRRGGKSRIAALVAVWLACFKTYVLAPGEVGVVMVIAADRRQARVVLRYIAALLDGVPMLKAMVTAQTAERIDLANQACIEVATASYRTIRGYTVLGGVADEIAFWRDETSWNPAEEILNALRPAMATVPGALLLCISSPYSRRGPMWEAYQQSYGKDRPAQLLVWQADTVSMNPNVDTQIIADAYRRDEAVASAEYGGVFRSDLETLLPPETLDTVVVPGRRELAPEPGFEYVGFVDAAGGSGTDSMTLAIAHPFAGGYRAVLDVVMERRPPFSPEAVVAEFVEVLTRYRIAKVSGDSYAGAWCAEAFRRHRIEYRGTDLSKSALYSRLVPLVTSRRVELPDVDRLLGQLSALERRTGRSGRDSIDHPPGAHDDVANVAAGALVLVAQEAARPPLRLLNADRTEDDDAEREEAELWAAGEMPGTGRPRREANDAAAVWLRERVTRNHSWFPGDD